MSGAFRVSAASPNSLIVALGVVCCAYRKSGSDIFMMQPAKMRNGSDVTARENSPRL